VIFLPNKYNALSRKEWMTVERQLDSLLLNLSKELFRSVMGMFLSAFGNKLTSGKVIKETACWLTGNF
jgi:hypothetical protein